MARFIHLAKILGLSRPMRRQIVEGVPFDARQTIVFNMFTKLMMKRLQLLTSCFGKTFETKVAQPVEERQTLKNSCVRI